MTVSFRDPSRLIFLDRLTQLYNWWFMAQYLRERFPWLSAEKIPLSAIVLNLDNFRNVNETQGRLAGDVILKHVAELLHEGRRRGGHAVRYAGDEFFVFLEGVEVDRALAIAEDIRLRVGSQPIVVPHAAGRIPITASLGVATFPDEAQTASGLIERARQGLARSKRLGKNRASRDTGERLPTEKEALDRFHRPRLLGRDQDLELCRTLFERASSEGHCCVLIEGEHGIGKSRFLSELPALARRAGLRFIQGGCLLQNQAVPYSALTPWLQEYFDRAPETIPSITARLSGPKLTALASLVRTLKPGEDGVEALGAPERRGLLFQGLLDLLCLISESAPLLVLLENFQWADEASLEVLLHLLSRETGKLLVCAAASTEVRQESETAIQLRSLPRFLPYFQASPRFRQLALPRLTLAQVGDLAAAILGCSIPARFQQMLAEVSRGVPLLVEETLKGLMMRGALREEEGAWNFDQVTPEDFPASAEEAIQRLLEGLEPETLEAVSEASVIGREVDLPVLAEVLGQDAAETLQIIDRGRRSGVFERIDPIADPGEIRFRNARLQEIVYDGLDPTHRRQSHRKVAEVYERLTGPQGEEPIGPLTYHFERSDDPGKAAFYVAKLRALRDWLFSRTEVPELEPEAMGESGAIKVRIPEASEPLDEHAFPLAVQFVKTLTLAAKNMRVYPESSQLVQQEVAGAADSLLTLLEAIDAVTVAEHQGALLLNGRVAEGKALPATAQDLFRFFSEHGIRSLTFVRGVIEPEVQELLRLLSGPPQGIRPEIARWDHALTARGIVHVGVFPAIYVAAKRAKSVPKEEAPLDDEALRLSAEVFRSLAAAVDNIRLYPPENELNVLIQERLERQAQALLERVPAVTLAIADENIVINGARPNPKFFGITIPLLHKLMQDNDLTSVTLTHGVTREDLGVFVTQLAHPREEDPAHAILLAQALEERGVRTIQVGTKFYAAARGSVTAKGAGGEAGAPARDADLEEVLSDEDRLFRQMAQWLEASDDAPAVREEEIPRAMEVWLGGNREDLARQLWEKIMGGLANPAEPTRQRSAAALHLLLARATSRTLTWLLGLSFDPLERALLQETSPRPFQWEVRAAADVLTLLLKDGDLGRAAGLAAALGTGQAGKPDQKKLLPLATGAVETLAETGAFEPLVSALREEDPARRDQGKAVLAALGEGILPFLAGVVAREEHDEPRRIAAILLRALPGAGLRLLAPQLHPPTPGETSRRIASVLDILAPELGAEFVPLLAHRDVLVRAEFAAVVSRVPRAVALQFLGRALGEREPDVLAGALECVRGLQATELLEVILGLVKRALPVEVLKAACLGLGQLKDERAVAPLVEILGRRPRFFGLVKGLPETVRAAAARGLGDLPFPEARRGLRAVVKDPSLAVRSTARLALARMQQSRESR